MRPELVPLEALPTIEQSVKPLLSNKRMLNGDSYDDLWQRLLDNKADLWVMEGLACVCSFRKDYRGSYYLVELCTSNVSHDFEQALQTVEEHAKNYGVDRIQVRGRKGWMRILPEYTLNQVIIEKQL